MKQWVLGFFVAVAFGSLASACSDDKCASDSECNPTEVCDFTMDPSPSYGKCRNRDAPPGDAGP